MAHEGGDRRLWLATILTSPDHRLNVILAHLDPRFANSITTGVSLESPFFQSGTPRRPRATPSSSERTLPPSRNARPTGRPPAIMLSLIFMVLFVNIAIYLVNTIGASTIDNLVCPRTVDCVLGWSLEIVSRAEARFKLTLTSVISRLGSSTSSCRHQRHGMHANNSARSVRSSSSNAR